MQDKPTLMELVLTSEYRDSRVVKHYGDMTMAKAMESQSPSLGRLAYLEGEDEVVKGVALMFRACSLYFGDPFGQDMAEAVVHKILGEYELRSTLKLEDLVVICKQIVASKQFGKFSANKLMTHIKGYQKKRMRTAIEQSHIQNMEQKHDNNLDERIHNSVKLPGRMTERVEKTREGVKKYYK